MTIERPNPKEDAPIAVLHMEHGSYFGYDYGVHDEPHFLVVDGTGHVILNTNNYSDFVTLFVEAAADI